MSVQQKNGVFYSVIKFTDKFGKRKYKWIKLGTNKTDAIKKDRKIQSDYDSGEKIISDKTPTVQELSKEYLELVVYPHLSPKTAIGYEIGLNKANKVLGNIAIDKLTAPCIQAWVNAEQERVKPTTARDYYNVLNIMLNQAVKWRMLTVNPCLGVVPPAYNKPNSNAYTKEQVQTLLDITQNSDIYIYVILGALCGLRSGEMAALCIDAIDLDNKRARICRTLGRMKIDKAQKLKKESEIEPLWDCIKSDRSNTVLILGPTKTPASCNFIPLPDIAVEEIKFLINQRKLQMLAFGPSYRDHGLIASWPDGTPIEQNYINKKFHKIIKAYNEEQAKRDPHFVPLPAYRIHDLRHTAATLMLSQHVDIKIVSRGLRHTNATFTRNKYQHVLDDMLQEPATVMNDLFKSPLNIKMIK